MLASDRLPPKHTIRLIQNDNDTQADALLLHTCPHGNMREAVCSVLFITALPRSSSRTPASSRRTLSNLPERSERRAKNSSLCSTGSTQKSLHLCRTHCPLVELHRVLQHSTPTRRSCWEAFHDQLKATQQKRGEHQNDKAAFYEAPKEKVIRTITDGFDVSGAPEDGGHFGLGLYLTPEPFAINRKGKPQGYSSFVGSDVYIAGDNILLYAIKSIRAKKAACSILASRKDGKSS
ncbi:hypothetical protein GW17_00057279 [Ensete ventricosum]|nr:hypothetical protein GW17_00057279 [Ensete ventricosum]